MPPATTTREAELLDAIRRDPGDDAALQVYADWLLGRGDTRGELVLLQRREPELDDPAALERLLELSAEHGFLRVPDDPDAEILRFTGGVEAGRTQVRITYELAHAGRSYRVVDDYFAGWIRIEVDGALVREDRTRGERRARDAGRVALGASLLRPEAASVILHAISGAIVRGRGFDDVVYPDGVRLTSNPYYRVTRFPTTPVPDELAARWPRVQGREIELRDLAQWRALYDRWLDARAA